MFQPDIKAYVLVSGRELPTGQNVVSVAPIEVPDGTYAFLLEREIQLVLLVRF